MATKPKADGGPVEHTSRAMAVALVVAAVLGVVVALLFRERGLAADSGRSPGGTSYRARIPSSRVRVVCRISPSTSSVAVI